MRIRWRIACWLLRFLLRRCPAGVVIIPRELNMADVVEGKVFAFSVKFTYAAGRVLASPVPTDAAAVPRLCDDGGDERATRLGGRFGAAAEI